MTALIKSLSAKSLNMSEEKVKSREFSEDELSIGAGDKSDFEEQK